MPETVLMPQPGAFPDPPPVGRFWGQMSPEVGKSGSAPAAKSDLDAERERREELGELDDFARVALFGLLAADRGMTRPALAAEAYDLASEMCRERTRRHADHDARRAAAQLAAATGLPADEIDDALNGRR